jgi:hypothetical protein
MTMRSLLQRYWPLLFLAAFLVWGWRSQSLFSGVPHYGDTLEFMWAISWYGDALRTGQSIASYPLAFFPGGWRYSQNLYLLLAIQPLNWLAGPAFAYNVFVLLTFIATFVGAFKLAREFVDRPEATIAALLITFWHGRWFHTLGHPNILLSSAALPWVFWSLHRGLQSPSRGWSWFVATGLFWTVAMAGSLYFAPILGVGVACWAGGYALSGAGNGRKALTGLVVTAGSALLFSLPAITWLWKSSVDDSVAFYTLNEVSFWGASLNSLPIPSFDHPVLATLARSIYRGVRFEQAAVNLGSLAFLLALIGLLRARKLRQWRPVLLLTGVTLLLALGLILKWDNEPVRWSLMSPINQALWQLGHWLKPALFVTERPPQPFDDAIPLPGMLLAIVVPFIERARVFARFALVGGIGVFLLVALTLSTVRHRWVRLALMLLLIVEVIPRPLGNLSYPPEPHPAFRWLKQQSMPGQSVADMVAGHPYTPVLLIEGQTVFSTDQHGKPTVAGASSVWPAHSAFLFHWLASHEHAFWNPDTVPILRFYAVKYVLLHMRGEHEQGILEEAMSNSQISLVDCFPGSPGPWDYPICILEILPSPHPNLNAVLGEGWSGSEAWGAWAEGRESHALWVATAKTDHRLQVEAFPICLDEPGRTTTVAVNGVTLATHAWQGCDPWAGELTIPAEIVQPGENHLVITSSHAARPVDLSGGENPDTRLLSAGFTQLIIDQKSRSGSEMFEDTQ